MQTFCINSTGLTSYIISCNGGLSEEQHVIFTWPKLWLKNMSFLNYKGINMQFHFSCFRLFTYPRLVWTCYQSSITIFVMSNTEARWWGLACYVGLGLSEGPVKLCHGWKHTTKTVTVAWSMFYVTGAESPDYEKAQESQEKGSLHTFSSVSCYVAIYCDEKSVTKTDKMNSWRLRGTRYDRKCSQREKKK